MSKISARTLLIISAALLPAFGSAAPPTAYLQNSKIVGTGKVIRAYRVPVKDIDGKVKYFDLSMDLAISNTGAPEANQTLKAVRSPTVRSTQFISGDYTGPTSTTCKVSQATLPGGRAHVGLVCNRSTDSQLTVSWITGPLRGHPLQAELVTAGVDKIPGAQNFGWGKVGSDSSVSTDVWFGCFDDPELISASQAGDFLVLSNYGADAVIDCAVTLVKTAP